jgi:hypothetical protein
MSVVPADELGGAANAAPTPESVWQRLSRAIDAYLAERTKKAIQLSRCAAPGMK